MPSAAPLRSAAPLNEATVRRIARLARIRLREEEVSQLQGELGAILGWIEQLDEVDVSGVDPLASVGQATLAMRPDAITDGGKADEVLANAPGRRDDFFTVPKVVE